MTQFLNSISEIIKVVGIAEKQGDDLVLDKERICLTNECNNGYVRYDDNGVDQYDQEADGCTPIYTINEPLILIAAVKNGSPQNMKLAFATKLSLPGVVITSSTTNRDLIADSEALELDKFCDFTLIKIEFTHETTFIGRKNCPVELC